MATGGSVEIVTQPVNLSESDAVERVGDRILARVKSAVRGVKPVDATLRYKPFYAFDVTLTKRVFRGDDVVSEGRIVVDALTDIARPFTKAEIDEVTKTVPEERVLSPKVPEDDATVTANSRRMQVEHREKKSVEMDEAPRLVYKPVWLVEMTNDAVRVVDGVDGSVYSDELVG